MILLFVEDVLISKYCYGWICPRSQKCIVRIVGPCKGFNCIIERSCRTIMTSSSEDDDAEDDEDDEVIYFINFSVCAKRVYEIYCLIPKSKQTNKNILILT